jgi:hypothetical protein
VIFNNEWSDIMKRQELKRETEFVFAPHTRKLMLKPRSSPLAAVALTATLGALMSGCMDATAQPTPAIPAPLAALTDAHTLLLEKNYLGMTLAMRDALKASANDRDVVQNVGQLLVAAAADSADPLPVDWKIPAGMSGVKITQSRRERANGSVGWKMRIQGDLAAPGSVSQIQMIRYPNEVVLDKHTSVGEWIEDKWQAQDYFSFTTKSQREAFADGLYLLNITMTNGAGVQGWFILSNLRATTAPEVLTPRGGDIVRTGTPTLSWENWYSTQYRSSDIRGAFVSVKSVSESGEWTDQWQRSFSSRDSIPTSSIVGHEGDGVPSLNPGPYIVVLNYHESRPFGDLRLRREGSRVVPFTVTAD